MDAAIQDALGYLPYSLFQEIARQFDRKWEYTGNLLEPLNTSTITVGGKFSNVRLHERDDKDLFVPRGSIVMTGSNYFELSKPGFTMPAKKEKTTNRGRKRKEKPQKKRIQGSGKYFNSQITCVVQSDVDSLKFYKFKIFRTGVFQVPGCRTTDLQDLQQPLRDLQSYFCEIYQRSDIGIVEKCVQMRNCKTRLYEHNLCINTVALGRIIESEMKDRQKVFSALKDAYGKIEILHKESLKKSLLAIKREYTAATRSAKADDLQAFRDERGIDNNIHDRRVPVDYQASTGLEAHLQTLKVAYELDVASTRQVAQELVDLKKLQLQMAENHRDDKNDIGIYSVQYTTDQNSSKVIVKFLRPVPKDPFKTTTLKVLKQKVNFEGAISYSDIQNIYRWLNSLLLKNYKGVIYDPAQEHEMEMQAESNIVQDDGEKVIVLSSDDDDASDDETVPEHDIDHDRYMDDPYN